MECQTCVQSEDVAPNKYRGILFTLMFRIIRFCEQNVRRWRNDLRKAEI